jgi:2-polyprenyl-6-methoxyphenol hydroxylase-like FAD-dependent oxidoreductase
MSDQVPASDSAEADVVIVGAGPTGLMLAIELCLAGVRPVVLERLSAISEIPKGNGLVGHIVAALDHRDLLERLRAGATYAGPVPSFSFGPLRLDLSRLGASPLHVLAIPQRRLEERLEDRLRELGGTVRRGHELTELVQDEEHVELTVHGPGGEYRLRPSYAVGCDGAHSLVRKHAGIGFPGSTSEEVSRIGRVTLPTARIVPVTGEVEVPGAGRLRPTEQVKTSAGSYSLASLASLDADAAADAYIISTREHAAGVNLDEPMTLAELSESVRRVIGADVPMTEPQWLTRTVGNSRQADRYQAGRILIAGDAAHVFGAGGSLNVGMADALNLGWKLAAQLSGWVPDGLLATYHAERHAAGRRHLMQTRAQKALSADGDEAQALRDLVGELLSYPEVLRHVGELVEGSDLRYDMSGGHACPHPLTGRFVPDLAVRTAGRRTRVAELMRTAQFVLLDFTPGGRAVGAAADWSGHVPMIIAEPLGQPAPADALLIRPDGYVAWAFGPSAASMGVPDPADLAGLTEALTAWCGPSD